MADLAKSTVLTGDPADPKGCIYIDNETGVRFREHIIDTGSGKEPVRICQITDIHFNKLTDEDRKNPELAYTEQCRVWLKDGGSIPSCDKAIMFSRYADATVITGDVLDFLSQGAIELMHKHIWDVDSNIIITQGNHEYRYQMQTKRPELTPISERLAILEKNWLHDIYYYSRLVGGRVLIVALDNGRDTYSDMQAKRLAADIAAAREMGYVILIFQHEAISTGKEEDTVVKAIMDYYGEFFNFYETIGHGAEGATAQVYKLITENADVIKGVYVGHLHSAFYTEIKASYINKNGEKVDTVIPQICLEGNFYDNAGHVMKIEVR